MDKDQLLMSMISESLLKTFLASVELAKLKGVYLEEVLKCNAEILEELLRTYTILQKNNE
jgi:hypothetical protein